MDSTVQTFCTMRKNNNRSAVTGYLNNDLKEKFDRLAAVEVRSSSKMIEWLIQGYVLKAEKEGKLNHL
jgi:predicted transcriptional regulator